MAGNMKPILFNTEMVRAILDGRKKTTRRIIKSGDHEILRGGTWPGSWNGAQYGVELDNHGVFVSPIQPGDVLYVRETFKHATGDAGCGNGLLHTYVYKADLKAKDDYTVDHLMVEEKWHPSIHMPKEAARIFLKVTDVRAERLREITNSEVELEGTDMDAWYEYDEWQHQVGDGCVRDGISVKFETLREFFGHTVWDQTLHDAEAYERYSWEANPWVFVISFERICKGDAVQ